MLDRVEETMAALRVKGQEVGQNRGRGFPSPHPELIIISYVLVFVKYGQTTPQKGVMLWRTGP